MNSVHTCFDIGQIYKLYNSILYMNVKNGACTFKFHIAYIEETN